MRPSVRILILTACAMVAATACGKKGASPQVIARVNDKEITQSQLNQALARGGSDPQTVSRAVDALVEEELLVQRALARKLDRDAGVMQAMEKARRQVLAQAYLERDVLPKGAITQAEQRRYFTENPALFEQRRTFELTGFTVKSADVTPSLHEAIDAVKSSDELRDVLTRNKVAFQEEKISRPAEQFPLEALRVLGSAKVGDVLKAEMPENRVAFMAITQIQATPVTFENAAPAITQFLGNRRSQTAALEYLRQAKAGAKVEYLKPGLAKPAAPETAVAPTDPKPTTPASDEYIKKGLEGLK